MNDAHVRAQFAPAAIVLAALAFPTGTAASPTADRRTLTIEDRVRAQHAIEEVYWRHRIWPKENPTPKPPLSAVLSDAAIRAKVEDYLKKSNALEAFWGRPVTRAQLQAELDRMTRHTRDHGMLREIFDELGNDAHLIAETLARPALANRLIRDWYGFDGRFHADERARAQSALAGGRVRDAAGTEYTRTTYRRKAEDFEIAVDDAEWTDWSGRPTGTYSPLQEDADRFFTTEVISRDDDAMTVATVSWPKLSFDSWWRTASPSLDLDVPAVTGDFQLDILQPEGCVNDTWERRIPSGAAPRGSTAVWTGAEMIVWGGTQPNAGARYDPAVDAWIPISTGAGAPSARSNHTAIWTGTEMIVWGGGFDHWYLSCNCDDCERCIEWCERVMLNTAGHYDPALDSWSPISTSPTAPSPRESHTAVWTGSEMIVWGGATGWWEPTITYGACEYPRVSPILTNSGARYDPSSKTWLPTSTLNDTPSSRDGYSVVWTGSEMIVWGGASYGDQDPDLCYDDEAHYREPCRVPTHTGGRYDPGTDTWIPTQDSTGVPLERRYHTAVWTGDEMIVWGGVADQWIPPDHCIYDPSQCVSGWWASVALDTGGRYDPVTDSWLPTAMTSGAPSARAGHTAVWTGDEMIVWGGGWPRTNTGGRYDPRTELWTPTAVGSNVPSPMDSNVAFWTGDRMLVWGEDAAQDVHLYCAHHNRPPVADAGFDRTVECQGWGAATVTLDGSSSNDPDSTQGTSDDIVRFDWIEEYGGPSEVLLGEGETLRATLVLGAHTITLRVTDAGGATATASVNVVVADTVPPSLVLASDPAVLWPPDREMHVIHVDAHATDACDPSPGVVLISATSSEPDATLGPTAKGRTHDIQDASIGTADFDILLRAERGGDAGERTYTLRYAATDGSGCTASAATIVTVPHDASTARQE